MSFYLKRSRPFAIFTIVSFLLSTFSLYLPMAVNAGATPPPPPPACFNNAAKDIAGVQGPAGGNNPCAIGVGHPVQLSNGNLSTAHADLTIPGRGMEFSFIRFYNSNEQYDGPLGKGWNHNFNPYLEKVREGSVEYVVKRWSDGRVDKFKKMIDGAYESPPGCPSDLSYENGEYISQTRDMTKHVFNDDGRLSRIVDRNNNQLTLHYDPATNRLTSVIDTRGKAINFGYSGGKITSVTDVFGGRTYVYAYQDGDLVSVTDPLADTVRYEYNGHRLTKAYDAEDRCYLENHYDAFGRVDWQQHGAGTYHFQYNKEDRITIVTDRNGNIVQYRMDEIGNLLMKIVYLDQNQSLITTYEYNNDYLPTKITYPRGNEVVTTYNDMGKPLTVTRNPVPGSGDAALTTTYTYEDRFGLIKTIDGPRTDVNDLITYLYDYELPTPPSETGNLMKIIYPPHNGQPVEKNFTYNSYGQLDTATEINGSVTKYIYYAGTGYIKNIIRNFGGANYTTIFTYDNYGNVDTVTDARGNTTDYDYNPLNLLTNVTVPAPSSYQTRYDYYADKTLKTVERETGDPQNPWQTTTYTYNNVGQVETITDDLGNITYKEYDYNGNLESVFDAEENETIYIYNERDLLWKKIDALTQVTEYLYDDNGNLEYLTDPEGNITRYEYDGHNRLEEITFAFATPAAVSEFYGYDKASNITYHKTRKGDEIVSQYDVMNRLTLKTYPDSSRIDYAYYSDGKLKDLTDADGAIHYEYYPCCAKVQNVTYPNSLTVGYEYDEVGNRTKITYPSGTFVSYEYDELNRLDKVKDQANNIIADYTHDALSRRTQVDYLNGTRASYSYDEINRLTELVNKKVSPETILSKFQYTTYDKLGNLKGMTIPVELPGVGSYSYHYDDTYQLTQADYPDGFPFPDKTFNYDQIGNRTSVVNGGTTTYVPNELNQYSSVAGVPYSYDLNGNLTDDGNQLYEYDYENHLIKARRKSDNALLAEYKYDPFGKRVRKIVHLPTYQLINFIYEGGRVIEERDGNNDLISRYVYGEGIDEVLTMLQASTSTLYYYHYDRLGSVVNLSDATGNVMESYIYDVFGQTNAYGSVSNPYFFTGRRYDSETGLFYYRARMYSPTLGRFLQIDPIGYKGGLNLYRYVDNNPINKIDPMGLFSPQKPGCDGISDHLETPCVRGCCDRHDRCYERYQCDASSWKPWCSGGNYWMCDRCNFKVVVCIASCVLVDFPPPYAPSM